MKVLGISLMRLGDLLMMEPVLKALKEKSSCEIHMLVYKECSLAETVIKSVDSWHYIDRKEMQSATRSADLSIFDNINGLCQKTDSLIKEGFTSVLALTHNKPTHLLSSILADSGLEVTGSHQKGNDYNFGSPWLKYLNDIGSSEGASVFHLVDIYRNALGLDIGISTEVDPDLFYRNDICIPDTKYICIQTTSNESKKVPGIQFWVDSISHYRLLEPDTKVLLLGAPGEESKLQDIKDGFADDSVEIAICNLKNAKALIHRAQMLVTPDTSIKYLAMGSEVKVLELSLGSSQYHQTGSYLPNSLIIQSKQACAPCGHKLACPYDSFRCHADLAPDLMGFSMFHFGNSDWKSLRTISNEYFEELKFVRSFQKKQGDWVGLEISDFRTDQNLSHLLHQSTWEIILNGAPEEEWQLFESRAREITQFLVEFDLMDQKDLRKSLEKCEANLLGFELETGELIRALSSSGYQEDSSVFNDVELWFDRSLVQNHRLSAFQRMYKDNRLGQAQREARRSGTQNILGNLNHMFKIERKLSEIIRIDFMEAQ